MTVVGIIASPFLRVIRPASLEKRKCDFESGVQIHDNPAGEVGRLKTDYQIDRAFPSRGRRKQGSMSIIVRDCHYIAVASITAH
jgi:hypothetical protein